MSTALAGRGPAAGTTVGPFRALDFAFEVTAPDPDLAAFLDVAWGPMRWPGAAAHRYELLDSAVAGPWRFELRFDGERFGRADRPSRVMAALSWHLNRQVVAHRGDRLVVHAAAAEVGGRAVLIPAAMGSGKTTLVAGLTRAGLGYLTDEAAALVAPEFAVDPFPKPLSVDQGSWEVLPELRPGGPTSAYHDDQWHVPATSVRADAVGGPSVASWIVTTAYRPDRPTSLTPMSAADAVTVVATSTFGFVEDPDRCLDLAAELVARCGTYRLEVRDLDEACQLILELVHQEAP